MAGPEAITFADFDARAGTRVAADVVYGHAPLGGRRQALHASIFLPRPAPGPPPMLVWLHGGDFHGGRHDQVHVRRLARQLAAEGFALAAPQYRLGAGVEDLGAGVRARLDDLAALPVADDPARLGGAAALAATEDAARFLSWLGAQGPALALAGRPVLGGSGAGAITAFNAAFLAPWLGLRRPEPGGILSYSGGFAWPDLYRPGRYPVFALHNPFDIEIGIASIRALSARDPGLELIEAMEQAHGALRVHAKEPKTVTFGRIRAILAAWSASAP